MRRKTLRDSAHKWRFAVDRGGTFTDIVGLNPSGEIHSLKLLSHTLKYKDASIEGIRRILGLKNNDPLPEDIIDGIRLGTTVATNALLERKGCKTVLLITKGLADLLEIGYQDRPDIFRLCIKKPSPLYFKVFEIDERLDCKGRVIKHLDEQSLLNIIEELKEIGTEAVAVVFMHSWINPVHELLCEQVLKKEGFSNIFLSHKTVNLIKIISRGQSTLVDAYLSVILAQYIEGIKQAVGKILVEFMQSNGVLSLPETFTGKNAILSGPAGGIVAVAKIAQEKGLKGAIGFDMGGTSTDVSRFDGKIQRRFEQVVGGIPLQTEMLDIITVAAGGGSILRFDGQKMTVGPDSAGSYPGPSCYGFGGPLTVTDANLLTGRIIADFFPKTFGRDGRSPLDVSIVKKKFTTLTGEINQSMGTDFTTQDVAAGFLRIANEKMAMAIKEISVSRGFDVRNYALVCFGGAGGQHACSIADLLDIETIIIHPLSGVLSAYGIGLARPAWKTVRTILRVYDRKTHTELSGIFQEMKDSLFYEIKKVTGSYEIKQELDLRPKGTETYLTLEYAGFDETIKNFKEQYSRLFGFNPHDTELEVVNLRIEIQELSEFLTPYTGENKTVHDMPAPSAYHEIYYPDGPVKSPVYLRKLLPYRAKIKGPSFIIDDNFTLVVESGFEAETDETGIIVMRRVTEKSKQFSRHQTEPDPVLLEVFNNLFMGVATEMGLTLKNTAYSVNMKERLDFSCAIFDSEGDLVANAPHIPVHLGSMADTVKAVLKTHGNSMKPGDIYLTNNPYKGGSHLSDMTVICPVYSDRGELIFFTASRGHHSDVGGITPGSMPPSAKHINEEGVLVDDFILVRDGIFREEELKKLLLKHDYPVRNITERILDLRAQIAACHKGVKELQHVIARYGLQTVTAYMRYIQDNTEISVKKALYQFLEENSSFRSTFEDTLDDGTTIKVSVFIEGGSNPPETVRAIIDFSGTGPQHVDDNLNAPFAVTRSAVIYVLRTLIDEDIPLNSGCLNPVKIIIPEGTILNPLYPAPVASGNVETSQRVVDVLIGAFGIAAASQGTMNNLLFEVEGEVPYYETIAGGAGAMNGCHGASGVQVHMTNTRMTDPEVLEFRHPGVRIEQFTLRKDSGGKGKFQGGDGVIREIKFLKPATVSIISERRVNVPYGVEGGRPGAKGINLHKSTDGKITRLKHREVIKVRANESIIVKTPGGGGYGKF
jgi:5-oxoprolinase (ATP-hydrolysing)